MGQEWRRRRSPEIAKAETSCPWKVTSSQRKKDKETPTISLLREIEDQRRSVDGGWRQAMMVDNRQVMMGGGYSSVI